MAGCRKYTISTRLYKMIYNEDEAGRKICKRAIKGPGNMTTAGNKNEQEHGRVQK